VRILVFHGYLLEGTGSNIYNARLAEALARLGHEVHLLSQERHAEQLPFVDAVADWDSGELRVRRVRSATGAGSCTVYRPDIGSLLPVYVADRYEGLQARTFLQTSDDEIARYVAANVAAVAELRELVAPQLALANHLVMGPVILARGLAGAVPYAVKIHGSALEYTVKADPDRFLPYAREGLAAARAVLVGSRHTALSLWRALGDGELAARTRLGPPGVDVARFAPRPAAQAAAGVRALAAGLAATAGAQAQRSDFARDAAAAGRALERLEPGADELVAFVGKLIVSKGVDLLLAAWPLVLARAPRARGVIVGFGAFRAPLERLCAALASGDLGAAREIARLGRALEHGSPGAGSLRHLTAFLDRLGESEAARESYLAAARALPERVIFTGRLEHDELAELLPACRALVVPSTFPESFGMVAAEAAACGVLPISAAHSGLAEVSAVLAGAVPAEVAPCLSFAIDDQVVAAIAERVVAWLGAGAELRERTRKGLVEATREHWSWEGVARGVIAAASGELAALREP
jgi:glycosyltransferase involved in cell wall biosynthesis